MSAPLLFLDTETTGLDPRDHIWECALILREPATRLLSECHITRQWFVEHNLNLAADLPERYRNDHDARYDADKAVSPVTLIDDLAALLNRCAEPPAVVGINPSYDVERLETLARYYDTELKWYHRPIDVTTLAVGYLAGYRQAATGAAPWLRMPAAPQPTWSTDDIARALGIDPYAEHRHTAMGDVLLASAMYDAVMFGGAR